MSYRDDDRRRDRDDNTRNRSRSRDIEDDRAIDENEKKNRFIKDINQETLSKLNIEYKPSIISRINKSSEYYRKTSRYFTKREFAEKRVNYTLLLVE